MLKSTLLIFLVLWLFWALYLVYVGALNRWNTLSKPVHILLAVCYGIPGAIIDVSVNLSLATIVFMDPPRHLTFTQRISAYKNGPDGWRKTVGRLICRNMLDPFEVGGHCS